MTNLYPVYPPLSVYISSSYLSKSLEKNLDDRSYLSPSLFESRDEIPVKWGSLSHPKIFDFGLCMKNTK
jgi:hypothetical protein